MKKFDFKKYVEFKVYSVTTIKKGYGFRVLLKFADSLDTTQQHAGFSSKREASEQGDANPYAGPVRSADGAEAWRNQ